MCIRDRTATSIRAATCTSPLRPRSSPVCSRKWTTSGPGVSERRTTGCSRRRRPRSELLPPTVKAKITHRWGGPVGLPRDWYSSVGLDRSSGIAWAGGYVGDGVSTTNLAGRTLADLITETDSDLTSLPWVNHKSRKWEPEPLRWIAVDLTLGVMGRADAEEHRTGRPSRRAQLLDKLVGR